MLSINLEKVQNLRRNIGVNLRKTSGSPFLLPSILVMLVSIFGCLSISDTPELPPDSSLHVGRLENGLRYFIQETPQPEGRAEIALVVNAGSVLEDDDQLGLAHFMEHMAFNGTELYPKNELVAFLEGLGIAFGADVNASTTQDSTEYFLPLATDQLDIGLEVLEEWAFHVTIAEDDVIEERGVLLEEKRLRSSFPFWRIYTAVLPFLFEGSRYVNNPIGTDEILSTASADLIRRYYEDWYRPDLMAIIVVGDVDAEDLEMRIRDRFSGYANPSPAREKPVFEVPIQEERRYNFVSDPVIPSNFINIFNRYSKTDFSSLADYRSYLIEELYFDMLNTRFSDIIEEGGSPFFSAVSSGVNDSTNLLQTVAFSELRVETTPERLKEALFRVSLERERLRRYGFIESELEQAKKKLLSETEYDWNNRESLPHEYYRTAIINHFIYNSPLPLIEWEWEAVQDLLPEIGPSDFTEVIAERLDEGTASLMIIGTEELAELGLTQEVAFEIMDSARVEPIPPWLGTDVIETLVSDPPLSGSIASEEYIDEVDIHRWTLSNGAVVYLKQTGFEADTVRISAFSPGGRNQVSDADWMSARLASEVVQSSGLADFTSAEIQKFVASNALGIDFYIDEYEEGFSASARDFESLLQMNYLYFTDLGDDMLGWETYSEKEAVSLENADSDPLKLLNKNLRRALYQGHLRSASPESEDYRNLDFQRARSIFAERFADIADFTFLIAGDFDLEEMRELLSSWLASIPSEAGGASSTGIGAGTAAGEAPVDRGFDYFSGNIRDELPALADEVAYISLVWQGETTWSTDTLLRLNSLAKILEIIINEKLREELGAVYAGLTDFDLERVPKERYTVIAVFITAPDFVDMLIEVLNTELENLLENGVPSSYLARIAEPIRVDYQEQLSNNDGWLEEMKFVLQNNLTWSYITNAESAIDSIDTEDLVQAIENFLVGANYGEIILSPAEGL